MTLYSKVKWLVLACGVYWMLILIADASGQYIGSGRPWAASRSEADSARWQAAFDISDTDSTVVFRPIRFRDIVMGSAGGAPGGVSVEDHIYFDVLVPDGHAINWNVTKFYVDSMDIAKFTTGEVGGVASSPGLFYYQLAADSLWYRADTSIAVIARAVSIDSVEAGETGTFQFAGFFTDDDYDFPLPGIKIVNDSILAGVVDVISASRDSTKKMHVYGWTTTEKTTIRLDIQSTSWTWVTP